MRVLFCPRPAYRRGELNFEERRGDAWEPRCCDAIVKHGLSALVYIRDVPPDDASPIRQLAFLDNR